ncbi:MAG: sugar ABC transporter substrate-binding protein [Marmoricola sp.]
MTPLIRRVAVTGAAAVIAVSALAGCGSSSDNNKKDTGSSSKIQVGVILPDTTSSTRYDLYDKPLLQKAFDDAGIKSDIQNAQGDKSKFTSIAQSMIGEGVKVLIIDSIDAASGAGVEKTASDAGVKVIDYDRVNLGGTAPYYVSFDNEKVGELQAQTMVDQLTAAGVSKPNIIMMDGGTDVDNNAVLFKKGAHTVLDPLQASGKLKITQEAVVKGWKVENAAPAFQQALTAAGGKVDGVVAANDDIAGAVEGVLKDKGLSGKVVITGQDAGIAGLQRILQGTQGMTVFKDVKKEADGASKLAIALIKGDDPASAGLNLAKFDDPQASSHDIQALLLDPAVITKDNVQDVIDAGALKAADICKGIESVCSQAGLS